MKKRTKAVIAVLLTVSGMMSQTFIPVVYAEKQSVATSVKVDAVSAEVAYGDAVSEQAVTESPLPTETPVQTPLPNPIRVKGKTANIDLGPKTVLKKSKVLSISGAKGALSFKKISGNKKIRINGSNGKVTVKERLAKGTYIVRVKVTAAGNDMYRAGALTKSFKIRVSATSLSSADSYNYNKKVNFGLSYNGHNRPGACAPYSGFSFKKWGAMYVKHPDKKEIYLTFDCGYDNGNTVKVLNTLKKKKVKAIFFITKGFLDDKPGLVKRMKREGHLVGNHTMSHPYMYNCSDEKIRSELTGMEKLMKQKTGYKMDRFIRPPYGSFSIRVLKTAKELGYKTVLWSLAWYDYDEAHQPSVSSVVDKFRNRYHKGMIPLLHITSSADTQALPQIISYMKSKKYKFCQFSS